LLKSSFVFIYFMILIPLLSIVYQNFTKLNKFFWKIVLRNPLFWLKYKNNKKEHNTNTKIEGYNKYIKSKAFFYFAQNPLIISVIIF